MRESQIATSVPTNIRNHVYLAGPNDATLGRLFRFRAIFSSFWAKTT